jgi:hypothetical protein
VSGLFRTTAPAARTALLSMLSERSALDDTTVRRTAATRVEDVTASMIWLQGVESTQDTAGIGMRRRTEDYVLVLVLSTVTPGDDPETAESRCFDLLAEVEETLREDPTLDGALRTDAMKGFAQVAGWAMPELEPYDDRSWACRITARVACETRI